MFETRKVLCCLSVLLLVSSFATGCGKRRATGFTDAAGAAAQNAPDATAQADAIWETDRGSAEGMLRIIQAYEAALEESPGSYHAMIRLARAYYFLGDGYTEGEEEKTAHFNQATYYGELAMGTHPGFRARIEAGDNVKDAVEDLPVEYIEAIYWTASALGKWAVMQGFATVVGQKNRIAALVTRVTELDDEWYHGAAHRYWGSFYAKAPAFAGGDMDKSRESFERALEISPNMFSTRVLYAQYYAAKAQERALFEEQLQMVLDGDAGVIPEFTPEQLVEQEKARRLMAQIDELF